MYKFILSFFLLTLPLMGHARLKIEVGIVHTLGANNGLNLSSELFSSEEVVPKKPLVLEMKSGIRLVLYTKYIQDDQDYGPSGIVELKGRLETSRRKRLHSFNENPLKIRIGGSETITYEDKDDQKIVLTIQVGVQ